MGVVSLLTDFGLEDDFVGAMKAVILKAAPSTRIVDITHAVGRQDVRGAAFLLASAFTYFPRGTVHLAVVDPGVGTGRRKLIVRTRGYYFVAPDNGILSLALQQEPARKIIEITRQEYFLRPTSLTFHGRDIFSPVAALLSRGVPMERFGRPLERIQKIPFPGPRRKGRVLEGEIVYVDHFGNLVSNIDSPTLEAFLGNNPCRISIRNRLIRGLSRSYAGGDPLKPLALISSCNTIEIAMNGGSAAKMLKARRGTAISVRRA